MAYGEESRIGLLPLSPASTEGDDDFDFDSELKAFDRDEANAGCCAGWNKHSAGGFERHPFDILISSISAITTALQVRRKTMAIGILSLLTLFGLLGFFRLAHSRKTPQKSFLSHSTAYSACSPQAWSSGSWELKQPLPDAGADVFQISGFEGCASDSEWQWHLGVEGSNTSALADYRRKASNYEYVPGPACRKAAFDKEALLRSLVEQGGWMTYGDSIAEESFFALSCMLYPHVKASRKSSEWSSSPDWRAEPQDLLLNPSSTLIKSLKLPAGFDIARTPLVSFRRLDLLFDHAELLGIHASLKPFNPRNISRAENLFGHEAFWEVPAATYLSRFTAPFPYNYRVLFVSTAGHWTTDTFGLLGGIDEILYFFDAAVHHWLRLVEKALKKDSKREVVVRAYVGGHENCHDATEPLRQPIAYPWPIYNWNWISDFNALFESAIIKIAHPRITFLDIIRPAMLRPDSHTNSDCLHNAIGAGVIEGWNDYISHYLSYPLASY